jgi:hypothetical protein
MTFLSLGNYISFYTFSVIRYAESEVFRVNEPHYKVISARVLTGITDGFISDPVDFVTHNRVHLG